MYEQIEYVPLPLISCLSEMKKSQYQETLDT